MSEIKLKVPPHSKDDEMMVLGSMITSREALKIGSELVQTADFYFAEHIPIFNVLHDAYKSGKPADVHLVCESLKKQERLHIVGGAQYVLSLAQFAGLSVNIEEYCINLRAQAFARKQIELSQAFCEELLNKKNDPFITTERYHQKQLTLAKKYAVDDKVSIGEVLNASKNDQISLIERLKQRQEHYKTHGKPFNTGIPTGFTDLDARAILLEDTHLIVVAGRPSMGKTTFALNIAEHVCLSQNLPVAIFSLEMSANQLAERIISSQSGVSLLRMKQGTFNNNEFQKMQSLINQVSTAPFFIYDHGNATISNIAAKARQLKEKNGIRLLVIDYLQLLSVDGGGDSRQYEVAEISRRLKLLAIELQIPILCVAQLSRKVEERNDKRPLMSDLRDSGQIEQDADAILFLYRKDYYDKNDSPGQAEVIIAKNRHGPTTSTNLSFMQDNGRFANFAPASLRQHMNEY